MKQTNGKAARVPWGCLYSRQGRAGLRLSVGVLALSLMASGCMRLTRATSAGVRELPWALAGGFVVPFAIVGDAVRESWQKTAPQEEGRPGAVSEQPPHMVK